MQDRQAFRERRTYGPNDQFEGAAGDRQEGVGDLRRGGQARHSSGDRSREGWSEGDMSQDRRETDDRPGGERAGGGRRYGRRSRELGEDRTDRGTSGGRWTGSSDAANDRETTREHAGRDEEGRTARAGFGDVGPMWGESEREPARSQGYGSGSEEYGADESDVTRRNLERGTPAYSERDESEYGGARRESRDERGGDGSATNPSATDRGTDRHERATGRGTQRGDPQSSDRAGQQSNRQHGTRRRSRVARRNPSEGSKRSGSQSDEAETGDRERRTTRERDRRFGSRRGHGSRRREGEEREDRRER
ncbi:hypothetical protein [Halostella litorea]|uniref:hypothetical protein n=1 Tax=Halostella litorea TaxID=2528831 RepID=UPI001092B309|nr:hypothetical protein [Halostella litorea]